MFQIIRSALRGEKKNFLLCVGCQKGGTTWLANNLRRHNRVDLGFTKEYHVFDALYVEECRWFYTSKIDRLKEPDFPPDGQNELIGNFLTHVSFLIDPEKYFDYFDYIHYKVKGKIQLVCDITPSYCALPTEALKHIKRGLEHRGFKVKVLFIIRDPLDRIWSAVRMYHRRMRRQNPEAIIPSESIAVQNRYSSPLVAIRSTYESTIKNLEAVFDRENIYYGIFEKFFNHDSMGRLASFLEIKHFNPDINKKVNNSAKIQKTLGDEISKEVVEFYKNTYEYCDDKFGLKDVWGGFKYL